MAGQQPHQADARIQPGYTPRPTGPRPGADRTKVRVAGKPSKSADRPGRELVLQLGNAPQPGGHRRGDAGVRAETTDGRIGRIWLLWSWNKNAPPSYDSRRGFPISRLCARSARCSYPGILPKVNCRVFTYYLQAAWKQLAYPSNLYQHL